MSIRLKAFTGYAEYEIRDDEDKLFADLHGRTALDAMRLAACWNACQGVSTANLEDNFPILELAEKYNEALRERDALAAKVRELEGWTASRVRGTTNQILTEQQISNCAGAEPVNARLVVALQVAHSHLEMDKLEISHRTDAALIRAAITAADGTKINDRPARDSAYGPDNPPRLRRPNESVEDYRAAMGWSNPGINEPAEGG